MDTPASLRAQAKTWRKMALGDDPDMIEAIEAKARALEAKAEALEGKLAAPSPPDAPAAPSAAKPGLAAPVDPGPAARPAMPSAAPPVMGESQQFHVFHTEGPLPAGMSAPDYASLVPLAFDMKGAALATARDLVRKGATVWQVTGPDDFWMDRADVERYYKGQRTVIELVAEIQGFAREGMTPLAAAKRLVDLARDHHHAVVDQIQEAGKITLRFASGQSICFEGTAWQYKLRG